MDSHLLAFQLSGGPPYGVRLQGGNGTPFVIAKLRPASKAEAVGLQEGDVVVAINGIRCRGLTHSTTTALMELHPHLLTVHVLRGIVGFGGMFEAVESAEMSMGSQLTVLKEEEAGALLGSETSSNNFTSADMQRLEAATSYKQMLPHFKEPYQTELQNEVMSRSPQPSGPQPSTTYSRSERTFQDGDIERRQIEETETKSYGGGTTRTTSTKREMSSSSFSRAGGDPYGSMGMGMDSWNRNVEERFAKLLKEEPHHGNWYGEKTEDRSYQSVSLGRPDHPTASSSQSQIEFLGSHMTDKRPPTEQVTVDQQPEYASYSNYNNRQSAPFEVRPQFGFGVRQLEPEVAGKGTLSLGQPVYEADLKPGQSVVMPGFTISVEARHPTEDSQGPGTGRLHQPIVTVTPAEADGQPIKMTSPDPGYLPYDPHLQRQDPVTKSPFKVEQPQPPIEKYGHQERPRPVEETSAPHEQYPRNRAEFQNFQPAGNDGMSAKRFEETRHHRDINETGYLSREKLDNFNNTPHDQRGMSYPQQPQQSSEMTKAREHYPDFAEGPWYEPPDTHKSAQATRQINHAKFNQYEQQQHQQQFGGRVGNIEVAMGNEPNFNIREKPTVYYDTPAQKHVVPVHEQQGFSYDQHSQPFNQRHQYNQQPKQQFGEPIGNIEVMRGDQPHFNFREKADNYSNTPHDQPRGMPYTQQSQQFNREPKNPEYHPPNQPVQSAHFVPQHQYHHHQAPEQMNLARQSFASSQSSITAPKLASHKLPRNPHFNESLLDDVDAYPQAQDESFQQPTYEGPDNGYKAQVHEEPHYPYADQHANYPTNEFLPADQPWNPSAPAYGNLSREGPWPQGTMNRYPEQAHGDYYQGGPPAGGQRVLPPAPPPIPAPAPPPPPPPPDPYKVYGITSADPEHRGLQHKVKLANIVADSVTSPENVNSRGQKMFLLRRQNSHKWTKSGPDPVSQSPSPRQPEQQQQHQYHQPSHPQAQPQHLQSWANHRPPPTQGSGPDPQPPQRWSTSQQLRPALVRSGSATGSEKNLRGGTGGIYLRQRSDSAGNLQHDAHHSRPNPPVAMPMRGPSTAVPQWRSPSPSAVTQGQSQGAYSNKGPNKMPRFQQRNSVGGAQPSSQWGQTGPRMAGVRPMYGQAPMMGPHSAVTHQYGVSDL